MELGQWLAMPRQGRRPIDLWQQDREAANLLPIDRLPRYTGEEVFTLTITDLAVPRADKRALFFCAPHTHAPAGTAAGPNVAHYLLAGGDFRGQPSKHARQPLLRRVVVTFDPGAHPGSRCWVPVRWWDGSRCSK